jgi:hypothetical protein
MKSQPNDPKCIHGGQCIHGGLTYGTLSLSPRLDLYSAALSNPLKHAANPHTPPPPPPCVPPPARVCTHRCPHQYAHHRPRLFPLCLSLSLPLSTLKSWVWCRFTCLRRPSDAYPAKSTPWHSRWTAYRLQRRLCRRPGSPNAATTWP